MKKNLPVIFVISLILIGCRTVSQPASQEILLPDQINPEAQILPTATIEIGEDGLTPNQRASLESLELLNEYPLYTMQYFGSYPLVEGMSAHTIPEEDLSSRPSGEWACSLFTALADPSGHLFGRNFDWEYSPVVLLFTNPPNGYASVSMVDIAYLGFGGSRATQLLDLPVSERLSLLDAPFLPFDGMNEYGLVVGMAAVPASAQPDLPGNSTIDSLMVIRLMLDHARNVEEALEIFKQNNLDWGSGPALHYLVADQTGRSALLEFWNGEMVVIENRENWQAATNFLQSEYGEDARGVCSRYDTISGFLDSSEGSLSHSDAIQLLAEVSQANTQWSVVYGMEDGLMRIVMGRDYEEIDTAQLEMAND